MTIYLKKVPSARMLSCQSKDGETCHFNGADDCCMAPGKLNGVNMDCWGFVFIRVPEPAYIFMKRIEEHQKKAFEKIKEALAELNENTHSL